ncbi:MAG: reverse transcriptase domain-containing protein [Armatimonadota bacterium]|nr:reverse transcriptase domain-containing protein [Armatimonadota bacterium]
MRDAYERLRSPENLWAAWVKVSANRGAPGADGISVEQFAGEVIDHFQAIGRELADEAYTFGPPVRFTVQKSSGGRRELVVPCVRDRVVLTTAARVLQDHLDPQFSPYSFGYRPGRSVGDALLAAERFIRQGRRWIVDADISACFDSIHHAILLDALSAAVDDHRFLRFVSQALQVFAPPDTEGVGIPQGSPLSPVLCNLYLDIFDSAAAHGGYPVVRYADDFLLFERSRQQASSALRWCTHLLSERLRLKLNTQKTRVVGPGQPLLFLGGELIV